MGSERTRLAAALIAASFLIGFGGLTWESWRFGADDAAANARLERETRAQIATRVGTLRSKAKRVADRPELVREAAASRDRLRALFDELEQIQFEAPSPVSATVWTPGPTGSSYTLLAWGGELAEDLSPDRLASAPALFVAPGSAGLRLVSALPITSDGHRIGVVAVEMLLSAGARVGFATPELHFPTTYGAVSLVPPWQPVDHADSRRPSFAISADDGAPLLLVRSDLDTLAAARRQFRWRVFGAACAPLGFGLLLAAGSILDRRRGSRRLRAWLLRSVTAAGLLTLVAVWLWLLGGRLGLPVAWLRTAGAAAFLGVVMILPVSAYWRRGRRFLWPHPLPLLVAELTLAAAALAASLAASLWLWRHITPETVGRWQTPLVTASGAELADAVSLLVVQVALFWGGVAIAALVARRWRVAIASPRAVVLALLWALIVVAGGWRLEAPAASLAPMAGGLLVLALLGTSLRRWYRHATEAIRLLLAFGALLVPVLLAYPLATSAAEQAVRRVIESEYSPATLAVRDPQALWNAITSAAGEIDQLPDLLALLEPQAPGTPISSQAAFYVWSQTGLSRRRLTSEVELYGPDRTMVSHFALNFAEFESREPLARQTWKGTSCAWRESTDLARFGREARPMLHTERGFCDAAGRLLGAVVLNVVPDYRALPFVRSASPYYELLGRRADIPGGSRIAGLELVVYGWSYQPIFLSGQQAWPITADLDQRLYESRSAFWIRLPASNRLYDVYFASDRTGVYALGYPTASVAQHLLRLSEVVMVLAALLVVFLAGGTLFSAIASRGEASLRRLVHEIRTSFYRKLFLFFVLAAVIPVVLFAIAFDSYMTSKFRADIEAEAAEVVTSARRFFEELTAIARQPDQPGLEPSDDVMVFIGQVIDQDVNLFEGPRLVATSQRDLVDSGLLPTRTPATAFRDIVLTRLPIHLGMDRIEGAEYFVAAARVAGAGRDAVLSVPLVLRQQELERQISDLNRGVLAGIVVVVLFAAGLGASVAGRVSDPVARLTRATRLIAAGRLDVRLVADTADELGRLVDDFNSMARTLVSQRAELARTNQLKAWAEMSRQVAHEIKNPLTPIQLAAEHLQRVHQDQRRPLGPVFDQCLATILKQVRLLRQIASEFSTFASHPTPRPTAVRLADLIDVVLDPYRPNIPRGVTIDAVLPDANTWLWIDRTLVSRALTNLVENALQAMPGGGTLSVIASVEDRVVRIDLADTGIGMDEDEARRAFDPYFSTKTTGSGLGLANAKRNIELCGGHIELRSQPGRGTTVTVRLPLQVAPAGSASA